MQEPPHFKRSALWQRERDITAWLREGYSFRQVAEELTRQGTKVSGRWLQEWYAKDVGRRRSRPRTGAGRPTNSAAPLPEAPTPAAPGMSPSPEPQASVAAAPADTDFSALFQSQFKRPRK